MNDQITSKANDGNTAESVITTNTNAFLNITDGSGRVFYGGDQAWLNSQNNEPNNGCAPVAAANILTYSAITQPALAPLFQYGHDGYNISKDDYLKFMEEIYKAMNPPVFGILGLNFFIPKTLKYATSKGVHLNAKMNYVMNNTLLNFKNFIKSALQQNIPVALFETLDAVDMQYTNPYSNTTSTEKYTRHWVVITGMEEDLVSGQTTVIVSTWGGRATINLNDYFNKTNITDDIISPGAAYFY